MIPLPIDEKIPAIQHAVRESPIVLVEAPPGAGKTTRVPAALLSEIPRGKKIYLLQPRRLAARSVAERIAKEHGVRLGDRIGYAVRFDQRVGPETQLVVATEGILIRRLQHDPTLEDVSVVVLDEFHERSLDADLVLGMLRRVQQTVREDLRIVIMSATMDREAMERALGNPPCVSVSAATYPVSIKYRPMPTSSNLAESTADTILSVCDQHDGDLLVFLPGAGEIHRCIDVLKTQRLDRRMDVLPLFGAMPIEEQARAVEEGPRRRVVVATNVAETSLTIPGVRTVIDSGMARVLRYSPEVGLDRLVLEPISSASATQRAGRAGRVAPGWCYRLWAEASERARPAYLEPEIRRVDLTGAMLELHAWGEGNSSDFPWLEEPRGDAVEAANRLLERLGAVNAGGITPIGRAMSNLPLHPRLARMVLRASELGVLDDAAFLAAMLSEREPFDRRDSRNTGRSAPTAASRRWRSDCVERVEALRRWEKTGHEHSSFGTVLRGPAKAIAQSAQQIRSQCDMERDGRRVRSPADDQERQEALMQALLVGFPDRLVKRRASGKSQGLMVGGKGVVLGPQSGVMEPELFLCIDLEERPGDALVRQASAVEREWLQGVNLTERDELFFHPTQKQVVARRRWYWIDLVLSETPTSVEDEDECQRVLFTAIKSHWDQVFPKDVPEINQWIARIQCLRVWMPDLGLPDIQRDTLERVAFELARGKRSLAEVRDSDWLAWIGGALTSAQRSALDREAPERLQVPSGSLIKIEYEPGKPPVLAVKIQEVFSWKETPRIAAGRVPLLLHLLAPNMRPQQVTNDLASFWRSGYAEVKKELKRRYPKHSWPDDPNTAPPTRR